MGGREEGKGGRKEVRREKRGGKGKRTDCR